MARTDYGAILSTVIKDTSDSVRLRENTEALFAPSDWSNEIKKMEMMKEATATAGSIVTFNDGVEQAPFVSLKTTITPVQSGSGDPYPAGGGVNKWDEVWEVGGLNTTTGANNDTLTDRIRSKNYIKINPSTSYYFVAGASGQTDWQLTCCFYDSNKDFISGENIYVRNGSRTTPSTAYYMRFMTTSGYGTTYANNISVNYPSTDTSYHPTANIRPISGWDSVKVSAVKQLFNGTLEQGSFNTGTGEKFPSTTRVRSVDDIPLPSGSYVLNNLNGWQFVLYVYDLEGNFKSAESYTSWKNNPLSFSLVANRKINFAIRNDTNTTIVPSDVVGLTLYDSTVGQTATIPLPHTVYGGELDIVSGKLVVTHKQVDLGDYSYTKYSNKLFYANPTDKKNNTDIMCDSLKFVGNYSNATDANSMSNGQIGGFSNTESSNHWLYVCVTGDMTPTALKEYVTGMKVVFELATPIEIQLTPAQLQARNGTNNVWADAGEISECKYYTTNAGHGIQDLFEQSDLIANTYIDNGSGNPVAYGGWSCTDFIEVTAGETLNFATANSEGYNCWYDSSKNFVSAFIPTVIIGGAGYGTITVPSGVSYMRLSQTDNIMAHTRVWRET